MEKKQYGWFWVCPNGGKDCHYRHALPPGYVLKSQMKALLEEEAEKITVEEEIEEKVCKFIKMYLSTYKYAVVLSENPFREVSFGKGDELTKSPFLCFL